MYSETITRFLRANGIKVGDEVELRNGKSAFEGILMPQTETGDPDSFVIKLKNGYNVGVKMDKDSKIRVLKSGEREFSFPSAKTSARKGLEKIALIYTGGTIGSKVDYSTGGVYMLTKPEELLFEVPELSGIANIDVRDLMHMASEDMAHMEWGAIAKEVADSLNGGARGAIITHGTDTMHFTSAALSFMLQNLNAPVVLTGAQRSSDRGSSDAFMNLICSSYIATRSDIAEVGICMHEDSSDTSCSFIRGTKARKMHTSRRDAFKPVNDRQIARAFPNGKIEYANDYRHASEKKQKVIANTKFEPKVALISAYPNSNPDIVGYYAGKGYKGLIIEGTGLGHVPVEPSMKENSWLPAIKDAIGSGMVVGMTSQCLYGRVNTNVYRNLRRISGAGVVYCEDMTPETAYVKLGFLLGNRTRKEAEGLLGKNIAGEITERSRIDSAETGFD
jgi:glutamyl-tRNA(Gln) amidotransferase subunit D